MLNKKLSPGSAIIAVVVVLAATAAIESSALSAKERADNPPRVIGMAYCTQCHSDAAMLAKMKEKEGNTHFLFHDTGPKSVPVACPCTKLVKPAQSW